MNEYVIQWRDESDLSRGFVINLENGSIAEVFNLIYSNPRILVNAFSDAFLLMRFPPEEAEELAKEMYVDTRQKVDQFIDRLRSKPYLQIPANHMDTH